MKRALVRHVHGLRKVSSDRATATRESSPLGYAADMRAVRFLALFVLALVPSCAGPTAEGTYRVSSTALSGNCPGASDATWSFRRLDDGAAYALEVAGTTGGCKLFTVDGDEAKLATACRITLSDGLVAGNVMGTLDYRLDFTSAGFEGTVAVELPPAQSLPNGCKGQNRLRGTRL